MVRVVPFAGLMVCFTMFGPLSTQQAQEKPKVVDVILVAGQSNAVGYDAKPSELPADPLDKEILFWYRCGDPPPDDYDVTSGRKWTTLGPVPRGMPNTAKGTYRQYGNFAQADGGFGPEMGLARTLRKKEDRPLAVIKAAFSGTSLAGDWDHKDPGAPGACYRALIKETKDATAAAKEKGLTLRYRALAWVQGESDANAGRVTKYAENLTQMLAALRKDLEAPDLIALLAVNTRFGGEKNQYMPKIVEAQKEAATKDPRAVYVDTATAPIANTAHYNSAGTLEVGQRMAEALLKMEKK